MTRGKIFSSDSIVTIRAQSKTREYYSISDAKEKLSNKIELQDCIQNYQLLISLLKIK